MHPIFRFALGTLTLFLSFCLATHAAPLTIEEATNPQGIISASLSPDGKHIAAIAYTGTNNGLILIDSDTRAAKLIIKGRRVMEGYWIFNKVPLSVVWVSNDIIAVNYGIEAESIDLNGKKIADLGHYVIGKAEPDQPDSPFVLVYRDDDNSELGRVDARTGKTDKLTYPMSGTLLHWAVDWTGKLRAVTLANSAFWKDITTVSNWYKPAGNAEWEKLAEFKVTDNYWIPLLVPEQPGKLMIMSSLGRDTRAIFSYDTTTHTIGEMMAGHPEQDIVSANATTLDPIKSVVTLGIKPRRYWLDPKWRALQASVDAALPGHINILSGNPDQRVLIRSYSDVDPGSWELLDVKQLKMHTIGRVKPGIDPSQMRPMNTLTYAARDGLQIPAYLTQPANGAGPQPTIVMIHGGPTARDHWEWNMDAQVLAARGYVVFQPQFRGSDGFGNKFRDAGAGQWGLTMQDDITDGVEYLIRQGIADRNRICIYGASYGGYAALWGMVKTPDLYRCGVSFAGVSDIETMFSDGSDSNDDKITRQRMRVLIGDIELHRDKFNAVSPLKHADRIGAPVLLMHGEDDRRVPIKHGKAMKNALDQLGKPYEWQAFEQEGHGLSYVRNQILFYEKLLAFLDKYIGPDNAAPVAQGKDGLPGPVKVQ